MVINQRPNIAEQLRTPRVALVRFPFGRPLGEPGDMAQHRVVAEDALQLLVTAKEQNTVVALPYRWKRTNFAAILQERKGQRSS